MANVIPLKILNGLLKPWKNDERSSKRISEYDIKKKKVNEGNLTLKYIKLNYAYYERGTKIDNKARFKRSVN